MIPGGFFGNGNIHTPPAGQQMYECGGRGMGSAVGVSRDPLQTPQMERVMRTECYQQRSISADRMGRESWRRGDGLAERQVIEIRDDEESDVTVSLV